jgi:photosystem II stability/assembly factor-like uncharacterized protein
MGYLTRFACAALAALAVLSAASAGVNNPQSGWYSGNPLLGPNTLRDLACAGSTCYASGDFGTLLKSQDNGATWNGIVTGLTLDLQRVRLAGGSPDRVIVGGGCALRRSDDGGNTFTRLPFTARDRGCSAPVVSFSFPVEKTGLLLLQGAKVLSTNDGGRSFTRRTSVPNGANDILCTSERTCFAVGIGGSGGAIMRTNDGAISWTQVGSATAPLTGLEQAGASTLYAVGANSTLAKSDDGGLTWTRRTISGVPMRALHNIRCGDASHCLVSTTEPSGIGGPLYRTDDGGVTFSAITPSDDPTNAVEFADASHAVAAGQFGSAEISADAGSTWASVGGRVAGSFGVLAATSESVAYAGGANGVLVRTGDGGQTWSNVSPPTEAQITGLAGSGPSRLYVLASDGTLQRSDNGGTSYSLLNQGTAQVLGISALDPDRLLLLGNGLVLSKNGGETFEAATGKIARAHLTAADVAPGAVFASGPLAIFKSTDRGAHWAPVKKPKRREIADLDFVGRNIGYLLDSRGALWKTINGGQLWKQLFVGGPGYAVEFSNHLEGYVAVGGFGSVPGGLVMRTSDGGQSWHPQLVSRSEIAELASGGPVDYALAGESTLYATTVGGDIGSASTLTISARPRALKRPGRVLVSGRLSPADGGEEIVVSTFQKGRWIHKLATAASNGTFVTRWPLRGNAVFVAQVLGDADHRGAGTKPLTVSVAH